MRKAPLFPALVILMAVLVLGLFYLSARTRQNKKANIPNPNFIEFMPLNEPTVVFGNPMIGSNDARVTIIEFGDYICPPCATLNFDLQRLAKEYPNDIRLVWKDFPNEAKYPGSKEAAVATRCAGYQNAFWEFHQIMIAGQAGAGADSYNQTAMNMGLDMDQFSGCLSEKQTAPLIERDIEEAIRLRSDATPYIFINGRRLSGAVGYDLLKNIVEGEISKAIREETENMIE